MLTREGMLTLKEAARRVRKHYRTVWQWASTGYHGTRLETIRVGKEHLVSEEALERFVDRVTARAIGPEARPKRQRQRGYADKRQQLRLRHGV